MKNSAMFRLDSFLAINASFFRDRDTAVLSALFFAPLAERQPPGMHLGELAFFVRPLALYIRLESLLRRQVQFLANMHDAFSSSSLFFERFHGLFFDE
jgi:hypothetical protein